MQITIEDAEGRLRNRLRERLESAGALRCPDHDQPIEAVIIHGRENGWFDSNFVTCCETLERKASAILKRRC